MATVKLIIRPWLSTVMGSEGPGPITLKEQLDGNATVGGVLLGLAAKNQAFGDAVFDASRENLNGRITIAVNGHLIGQRKDLALSLKDGDTLTLFPTIEGG